MVKNFVSISGIRDDDELFVVSRIGLEEGIESSLTIGYQVSHKSINTGSHNNRQPRFESLAELDQMTRVMGNIPAIHYYTKDQDTILPDLEKIANSGVKPGLLQFNTLPPSPRVLEAAKQMGYSPIFKVAVSDKSTGGFSVWKGQGVEDASSGSVVPLIAQVAERRAFVDYVMFDPSHGTNLQLELAQDSLAVKFGLSIATSDDLNHLGLIFAGGINPKNVGNVTRSLASLFPRGFSIDAESGVRTDDKLDWDKVRGYLAGYQRNLGYESGLLKS